MSRCLSYDFDVEAPSRLEISDDELKLVDRFRKGRDTAILTVMFTDIEGFTQLTEDKGEDHSKKLRDQHNHILKKRIEEYGSGLIVKYMGDAVMAIFTEPSSAVESALKIQSEFKQLNENSTSGEELLIRIGLHLGQVSVENKMQIDVFGSHVNRASRIEALAHGGQILLSYPVFDSAKGWLSSHEHIKWTKHGYYQLKGIHEETAIYEVVNTELDIKTTPPKGAIQRASKSTAILKILTVLLIGLFFIFLISSYFSPNNENSNITNTITLNEFYGENLYVNGTTPILVDGKPGDKQRKLLTPLALGKHVVYYDVSFLTRFYAKLNIVEGDNLITPNFERSQLPDLNIRYQLPQNQTKGSHQKIKEFEYHEYDSEGNRIDHHAQLAITVNSSHNATQNLIIHQVDWSVIQDGKKLCADTLKVAHPSEQSNAIAVQREEPVHINNFNYFNYHYYTTARAIDFTLHGGLVHQKETQ